MHPTKQWVVVNSMGLIKLYKISNINTSIFVSIVSYKKLIKYSLFKDEY